MIIKSVDLETVCGITSKLPDNKLPEIAFAGKSNVGKSSLINALINRKAFARTSQQPGKTQTINFYNINEEIYFVDLPGYGFAKASKETTNTWDAVMNDYFVNNEKLKLVMVLLDCRHKPTELDKQMINYLADNEIRTVIILTKTDKINRSELNNAINNISKEMRYNKDLIVPTSASKKVGVEKIGALLDNYLI